MEMRQNRVVRLAGTVLLMAGFILVSIFLLRTYSLVYGCEHGTGAVPVQGCTYFLQLPVYLWSGAFILIAGVSLTILGSGLFILGKFENRGGS
jgi:hypothetical protein